MKGKTMVLIVIIFSIICIIAAWVLFKNIELKLDKATSQEIETVIHAM